MDHSTPSLKTSALPATVKTYLINLDRSPVRLTVSSEQLVAAGVPFERITAVDANAPDFLETAGIDEAAILRIYGRSLTKGEIGCYLSHLKALHAFISSGNSYALILEDDFVAAPEEFALIAKVLAYLTSQNVTFAVTNFGKKTPYAFQAIAKFTERSTDFTLGRAFLFPHRAHAVLWTRQGATAFLAECSAIRVPFDEALVVWASRNGLGICMRPAPVRFGDFESTIGGADNQREKLSSTSADYKKRKARRKLINRYWAFLNRIKSVFGILPKF